MRRRAGDVTKKCTLLQRRAVANLVEGKMVSESWAAAKKCAIRELRGN